MDTRIPMIETTMRISISVNPTRRLPLRIGHSIASLLHGGGIDVEHILAAPGHRLGVILHAALAPITSIGHGIERDSSQELHLLVDLVGDFHAFDQNLQRLGISFSPYLQRAEVALVGAVLIPVDGSANLIERPAQLALFIPPDLAARDRDSHAGQDHHDRARDNQLDERHAAAAAEIRHSPDFYLTVMINGAAIAGICCSLESRSARSANEIVVVPLA